MAQLQKSRNAKETAPPQNGAELRLPRPYGGEIVIRAAENAEGIEEFFAKVTHWFKEPAKISLFDSAPDPDHHHHLELAAFAEAAKAWERPVDFSIDYVLRPKSDIPADSQRAKPTNLPAVKGETYCLPATLGRRAIAFAITGAQEAGEKWIDEPSKHIVTMREGAATAVVTLRPLSAIKRVLTDRDRDELREALQRWKEIDQDVLDILVTNALNESDRTGRSYISYANVLDAREISKKSKIQDGKRYAAGHRPEDRDEIHKSILRLYNMAADVAQSDVERKQKHRRVAPVVVVHELQLDGLTNAPIGVWYSLGSWAETATDDVLASRRILSYDPYRQSIEKRLGRILTIILAERETADCLVADIINEIRLPIEGHNRGRSIARFDKALEVLHTDGVIGAYSYSPDVVSVPLPTRGTVEDWLERRLIVRRLPQRVTSSGAVRPSLT